MNKSEPDMQALGQLLGAARLRFCSIHTDAVCELFRTALVGVAQSRQYDPPAKLIDRAVHVTVGAMEVLHEAESHIRAHTPKATLAPPPTIDA